MVGDESMFPGGIYWEGRDDGDRADVSLQESGTGTADNPLTLGLIIVTGNAHFSLLGILPQDLKALAKWMHGVAKDVITREKE